MVPKFIRRHSANQWYTVKNLVIESYYILDYTGHENQRSGKVGDPKHAMGNKSLNMLCYQKLKSQKAK